jgi:hypothetical protein
MYKGALAINGTAGSYLVGTAGFSGTLRDGKSKHAGRLWTGTYALAAEIGEVSFVLGAASDTLAGFSNSIPKDAVEAVNDLTWKAFRIPLVNGRCLQPLLPPASTHIT